MGAEDSEVEEKPWIKHQLCTNPLSRHFAVLLSQLFQRSLEIRVKSCGTSEDLDRQAMLKEISESSVSQLYIEKEGSLTLASDKYICEVIIEMKADIKLLKGVYEPSRKLIRPHQGERDKLSSHGLDMEVAIEHLGPDEAPGADETSRKRARQAGCGLFSRSSRSFFESSTPQKIRMSQAPGI